MNRELIDRIDRLLSAYAGGGKISSTDGIVEIMRDCKAALSQEAEPVAQWMPILGTCLGIPMELLDERRARINHRQSLDRLKERGGLSLSEAVAIAESKPWRHIDHKESLEILTAAMTLPTPKPAPLPQPVASAPQDVEEFIAAYEHPTENDGWGNSGDVINTDDLRAWMAGHARVQNRVIVNLVDALKDARSGMRCIRQTHGDLYGIGFDRVEKRSTEALRDLESCLLTASKEMTE